MKKNLLAIMTAFIAVFFVACSDDDAYDMDQAYSGTIDNFIFILLAQDYTLVIRRYPAYHLRLKHLPLCPYNHLFTDQGSDLL